MCESPAMAGLVEYVLYGKDGACINWFIDVPMGTDELMECIDNDVYGVLMHNAVTGRYIGRA